jgi:MYXO-CTERM domain-containing protein
VCIQVESPPAGADAGTVDGGGFAREFCAPVTVADLAVTDSERAAHAAALKSECAGDAGAGAGTDAGVSNAIGETGPGAIPGASTSEGGCSSTGRDAASNSWLLAIPLAAAAFAARRKRRSNL